MKLQSHISPAAVAALLLVVPLKVTELEALGISLSTMSHQSKENSAHSVVCFMSVPNKSEDSEGKQEPKAEYGVSYIGGDPCGSKYNDDPFDAQVQKPGMWRSHSE